MRPIEQAKDGGYELLTRLEERLARGEIDEETWHREVQAVIVPAYLAAETPWGQSGKSGDFESWTYSRSHIAEAIDRDGSFLDVGCASGLLMECMTEWCREKGLSVEPYGLDISPELADLARRRLPYWADRIFTGNARVWEPPMRFDFVRTGLEYVPTRRKRDLVEHLMTNVISPGGRLIIGNQNEERELHTTEELVESWGYRVAGRSERPHTDPRLAYRVIWINL